MNPSRQRKLQDLTSKSRPKKVGEPVRFQKNHALLLTLILRRLLLIINDLMP
jgi:hypothetical protein